MNDTFTCLRGTLPKVTNFSDDFLEVENLCQIVKDVFTFLDHICRHAVMIPLILLTITSIFGNIQENYRWIVCHTGVLNFVAIFIYALWIVLPSHIQQTEFITFLLRVFTYVHRLSLTSMLPLAINRFFKLYFPKLDDFLNNRKGFLLLFAYDALISLYTYLRLLYGNNIYMDFANMFLLMFLSIIVSIFVLIKINHMRKMAQGIIMETTILSDVYRAAIICIIHPLFMLIFFLFISVGYLFNISIHSVQSPQKIPHVFVITYLFYQKSYYVLYEIFMLIDTCMLLFMLKSYRKNLFFILSKIYYLRCSSSPSSVIYFNT